jgi:hypothetical protein
LYQHPNELAALVNEIGVVGFYGRHIDHGADDDSAELKRSVSLLFYMNDYGAKGWDEKRDGGALVGYPSGMLLIIDIIISHVSI